MMDFRRVDIAKQKAYDRLRDWIKLVARHTNPDQDISELLGWLWKLKPATPDPTTGLVPCGCGGVTEQTDFHDGFFPYSKIECLECGIQMMRAGDTFLEAHAEIKRDWNTAMGWKGGAE